MADQEPSIGGAGGFAPLGPTPGPSLEEEERAMRSGRGRMIAAMVIAVLAAGGGFAWYLTTSGPNEYGQIGRQINGMKSEHFDAFWACALPGQDVRDIANDQQLRAEIVERARQSPSRYAQMIRETCMDMLDDHVPLLDALLPPEDIRAQIEGLRAALTSLRTAWAAWVDHLSSLEGAFDEEVEREALTGIARAWFDYKVAHRALNDLIRTHTEE
jgi:hypothetical protein